MASNKYKNSNHRKTLYAISSAPTNEESGNNSIIDECVPPKSALTKSTLTKSTLTKSAINRRRFLSLAAGGGLALTTNNASALSSAKSYTSSNIKGSNASFATDLNTDYVTYPDPYGDSSQSTTNQSVNHCNPAVISTRLFASSSFGFDIERSTRGLNRLACAGFNVQNPQVIHRRYLRFSGSDNQRANDLQDIALSKVTTPQLLLGVRGGYGAMRVLEQIDWRRLGYKMKQQGTIMAGFSDVTAFQCALLALGGMSSLAAPMLYSEFGKPTPDLVSCQQFVEALTNPALTINSVGYHSSYNPRKTIRGTLWGGNLSVVAALAGSKYMPNPKDGIVFLEDVGEQPYSIERMLYSLYLSGAFKNQQAIVLGVFARVGEDGYDSNYNLTTVINQLQRVTGIPIYTGIPFGHAAKKHSLPLGAKCQLTPNYNGFSLKFSGYPVLDNQLIKPEALWQ